MTIPSSLWRIGAALIAALLAGAAGAQTQRSGGGASPQIMQQYQQLSAEKTQLSAENARLKKEADDAKQALGAVKKERDALKSRGSVGSAELERARLQSDTAQKALEKSKQSLEELIARFRETAATLQKVESEKAQLQEQLTGQNRAFDTCAVRNSQLFELSSEVLDRWEHEGAFTRIARSEPFFRLKRTELENLTDQYRERAQQLKMKQSSAPAASPTERR